jgi:hypothetical protein
MYSIQKILPGLKLTFILIIFGCLGMCLLENNARNQWKQPSDPASYMQLADIVVTESEIPVVESYPAAEMVPDIIKPELAEPGKTILTVHSLSDLGLHIEL